MLTLAAVTLDGLITTSCVDVSCCNFGRFAHYVRGSACIFVKRSTSARSAFDDCSSGVNLNIEHAKSFLKVFPNVQSMRSVRRWYQKSCLWNVSRVQKLIVMSDRITIRDRFPGKSSKTAAHIGMRPRGGFIFIIRVTQRELGYIFQSHCSFISKTVVAISVITTRGERDLNVDNLHLNYLAEYSSCFDKMN